MQIYRGMPILTQAPTPAEKRKLKMHLVEFLPPSRSYNAALFRTQAEKLIRAILDSGRTPLIVGGTGLYIHALLDGLFDGDDAVAEDETFRESLKTEAARVGAPALHERLKRIDPETAGKLHPNDLRRIIRALEVYHLTQKPISWHKPRRSGIREKYDCRIFVLDRDRADLYRRIDDRVRGMVRRGMVREVRSLSRKKLSQTAQMALGIRQIRRVLLKEITLQDAVSDIQMLTRRYAKRQISWFRRERSARWVTIRPQDTAEAIARRIVGEFQS